MKSTLFIFFALLLSVFAITIATGQNTTSENMGRSEPFTSLYGVKPIVVEKTTTGFKTKEFTTVVCGGVISTVSVIFRQLCSVETDGFYACPYDGEPILCQSYNYNAERKCVTVIYNTGTTAQYYHQ